MTGPDDGRSGRILVVDDHEPNRLLLTEILAGHGYDVVPAESGREALEQVERGGIDLVLLDVNMPGMNGLDVCRAIRQRPETVTLPVLLVTALAHREQRLEGIAAGANDYLTKPVDRSDLLLRVRNALHLHQLHQRVVGQYARLRELEQLRDGLVHMLVHDLRGPLTGMMLLIDGMHEELALAAPELATDCAGLRDQVRVLAGMITNVLDVSRLEAGAMPLSPEPLDLRAVVTGAVATLGLNGRGSIVQVETQTEPVAVAADAAVLRRVITNLVDNAVKFAGSHGSVRVRAASTAGGARLEVTDSGPGVPADQAGRVFEKFARLESQNGRGTRGHGLGLTFCKLAVEAHGGRIGVSCPDGGGATFWVELPGGDSRAER